MTAELDRLRAFVEAYIENATQRHEMMTSHDSWPGNARAQGEMTALESVRYMIAAVGQAANPGAPHESLPPVGSDAWAMAMLLQGKRVRRKIWHGAIYIRLENDGRLVNRLGSPATMGSCADNDWELYNG